MNRRKFLTMTAALPTVALAPRTSVVASQRRRTEVGIQGDGFLLNGRPTYPGRYYKGLKIEGLLMNVRVVQGIFDDLNPETRGRWVYPDTGKWDPERNTMEFIAAMPEWRRHGVLGFTINLQGGTPGFQTGGRRGGTAGGAPAGRTGTAPGSVGPPAAPGGQAGAPGGARRVGGPTGPTLENSAIDPAGNLRPAYMMRLAKILDRADELGMVAIVSYFYFGQDERVRDEAAVRRGVLNGTNWLLDRGYRNVLVEVNNECNLAYDHDILKPARVHELIQLVKSTRKGGRRLLVGTSYGGPTSTRVPGNGDTPATANVIEASDFALLHGNGPDDTALIRRMIRDTRQLGTFRTMPVLINEDNHYRFDEADNTLLTALEEYVSWGYYDQGQGNYLDGFQSPPVNWGISTDLKKQFFAKVKEVTGA